jgi:hypothetical protein
MQELPSFVLIFFITAFVIWSTNKKGFFLQALSMGTSHIIAVPVADNSYKYRFGKARYYDTGIGNEYFFTIKLNYAYSNYSYS